MLEKSGMNTRSSMLKPLKFLAIEIILLIVTMAIVFVSAAIAIAIASCIYNLPNPILGEKDLGPPLILIYFILKSLFFSIPASILVHIVVFKKFPMR
jgi:hypothetical protein